MIFHRAVFYLGTLITVLAFVLPPETPTTVRSDTFSGSVLALFGVFSFFYAYAVGFCLVDIVWKRWRKLYLWLPFVALVPLAGPYVYFEKFIFPTYFRRKTPEEKASEPAPVAVPLSMRLLRRRALAAAIDFSLYFFFVAAYIWTVGTPSGSGVRTVTGAGNLFVFIGVWFLCFPLAEGIWGMTLGKRLMHIKVIMIRGGGKVTFGAAVKRHLLDFVDLIIVVGVVAVSSSGGTMPRRLGDRWAGTVVTGEQHHELTSKVG
jgi:hypothetical protein